MGINAILSWFCTKQAIKATIRLERERTFRVNQARYLKTLTDRFFGKPEENKI